MIDQYHQTRWDLRELLLEPDGQDFKEKLDRLDDAVNLLEELRPGLSSDISIQNFLVALNHFKTVIELTTILSSYAYLWFTEDTQNRAALNFQGRLDQTLTEVSNRTLFFGLWFKDLPDSSAERLIAASGDEAYFLVSLRRFKPHALSERDEQIINYKDSSGMDTVIKLYDILTNRFTFNLEVDGQTRQLTRDELSAFYRHPSPAIRQATYQELYRVYQDNAIPLSEIYASRVRDWHDEQILLRGYQEPISVRNLANDLPDSVVDTLLSVCRQNNGLFQRYFKLKAGWLGVERLRRYDLYAPLATIEKLYSYEEGVQLILNAFQDFSPQVREAAERVFSAKHLDAQTRPGKRGGAYCLPVLPDLLPWVTVNYAGRARDVATLAHELGHAVHNIMASQHSVLVFQSPIPLAETASVFAEMLLIERLTKDETDPAIRRDILAYTIDDAWATVQRQAYFTIFERQAHQMIIAGEPTEKINATYRQLLVEQFGDAITLAEEFDWEWLSVPHLFDTPFYTYGYSFGQLLVLALYQRYKEQGAAFLPGYLKILSYGGSASPEIIMQEAGFDIRSPEFWQGGYTILQKMISDLEALN